MPRKIIVNITKEGKITRRTVGFKGKECLNIDSFLNELGTVTENKKTSDYYRSDDEKEKVYIKNS